MDELETGLEAFNKGDYLAAFHALKPFAVNGDIKAEITMGYMHEKGLGVPQHYGEARKLYGSACRKNSAWAQSRMGIMHYHGLGRPIDYITARTCFTGAAKNGIGEAQYYLGLLYENGQKVDKDLDEAHMWYNLSASNGYEKGAEARDRIAVEIKMDIGQIAEAQQAALEWFYQNLQPAS